MVRFKVVLVRLALCCCCSVQALEADLARLDSLKRVSVMWEMDMTLDLTCGRWGRAWTLIGTTACVSFSRVHQALEEASLALAEGDKEEDDGHRVRRRGRGRARRSMTHHSLYSSRL